MCVCICVYTSVVENSLVNNESSILEYARGLPTTDFGTREFRGDSSRAAGDLGLKSGPGDTDDMPPPPPPPPPDTMPPPPPPTPEPRGDSIGVTNKEISGLTMPPPTPESRGDSNLAAGDLGLNVD